MAKDHFSLLYQIKLYIKAGRYDHALDLLSDKDLDPWLTIPLKGYIELKKGFSVEALKMFQTGVYQAQEGHPTTESALCLAILLSDLGAYSQGEQVMKSIVKNKESSKNFQKAQNYFECAKTAYVSGALDEAIDFLQKAVHISPKWQEPKFLLIQVFMEKGQPKNCHKHLDDILAEDPDSLDGLLWKGAVFCEEKNPHQGKMAFEKAQRMG